jgi:hypothetical protein
MKVFKKIKNKSLIILNNIFYKYFKKILFKTLIQYYLRLYNIFFLHNINKYLLRF